MPPASVRLRQEFRLRSCFAAEALAILLCAFPASTSAEPWPDRACFDPVYENMHPECTENERRSVHARLGLAPFERLRQQRRARNDVIVGYGWFNGGGGTALIFLQDRHGQSRVEVRVRPRDPKRREVIIRRATIPQASWTAIVQKARSLDFTYRSDRICTAGASFMIETMDETGVVRTLRHDPCYIDEAIRYFDELGDIALSALPACTKAKSSEEDLSMEILERCLAPSREQGRLVPEY